MFYLILKKNFNLYCSYNLLIVNSKKKFLKKLGVISFNNKLNKFILLINLFEFFWYLIYGIYISNQFKIYINKLINNFKL